MLRRIEYSPRALKDLDGIWDYIEKELCNPSAAQNTVEGIMDKIDILMSFPEAGAKLEFENGLNSGYRYVSFKNYLAFYRLRSDGIVYIDRVIYSGRDYMRILFPNIDSNDKMIAFARLEAFRRKNHEDIEI